MKLRLLFALSVVVGPAALLAGDETEEATRPIDPALGKEVPLLMEPMTVETVFVTIKMRPFFRDSSTGSRVSRLLVEEVRANSRAERAGVKPGMEIVAIQGTAISGLRDVELEKLIQAPVFANALVLKVVPPAAAGWRWSTVRPEEIRIPLAGETPTKPARLSNVNEPKKPAGK